MTRRSNERSEADLIRRQAADRKQTMKVLKAESRSRVTMFRDRLKERHGVISAELERNQIREVCNQAVRGEQMIWTSKGGATEY